MTWTLDDIGRQDGRRVLITGATGGLGLHTALELGRRGADLVLTARDTAKAADLVDRLTAEVPGVSVELVSLDLADLTDVARAAAEVQERFDRIDVLVNNAGIMLTPPRKTVDGFELQMGTNHLGHFAWTARLWPLLDASKARVVTVSSLAHTSVRSLDLRALTPEGVPGRYRSWAAYSRSKLANLVFALELNRRVDAAGVDVLSVAAHPGYSLTHLTQTGPTVGGSSLRSTAIHQFSRVVAQPASHGAWPLLMAATDPTLPGGAYVGPSGPRQFRGAPRRVGMTSTARDPRLGQDLWAASEAATGVSFPL